MITFVIAIGTTYNAGIYNLKKNLIACTATPESFIIPTVKQKVEQDCLIFPNISV